MLDALRDMGFRLPSLSNNHADDLGVPGILSTIDETKRRGFGTPERAATLPKLPRRDSADSQGKISLVAKASSSLPPESFATETQAGVNHLSEKDGVVAQADTARVLAAIMEAARQSDYVFVYNHDHYWAPDWQDTPDLEEGLVPLLHRRGGGGIHQLWRP